MKLKYFLLVLLICFGLWFCQPQKNNFEKLAVINPYSSLETAVKLFIGQSGATLFASVGYDYDSGTQIVDYLFPASQISQDADIFVGKRVKIADRIEVYQGHLNYHYCFYHRRLVERDEKLGLNYRISWAFYENNPRPSGYIVVWFPEQLTEQDSLNVCGRLKGIAEKMTDS